MEPAETVKKLQTGEINERSVEFCVDCPMHGSYVTVDGNCIDLQLNTEGKRRLNDVKLHAKPDDFFYAPIQKCEYAVMSTSKPTSGDLTGIICSYKID